MKRHTKIRLAALGGIVGMTMGSFWLLDVLEKATCWALIHWAGMDWGKAAARAPAMSALLLCGLFALGLYGWAKPLTASVSPSASALRSSPKKGSQESRKAG